MNRGNLKIALVNWRDQQRFSPNLFATSRLILAAATSRPCATVRMPGRGTTTGGVPGSGEAVFRTHGRGGVGGKQLLQVGAAAGLALGLLCRAVNKNFTQLSTVLTKIFKQWHGVPPCLWRCCRRHTRSGPFPGPSRQAVHNGSSVREVPPGCERYPGP